MKFLQDTSGATAVEYSVLLALLILSAIGIIASLGSTNGGLWDNNVDAIDASFGG